MIRGNKIVQFKRLKELTLTTFFGDIPTLFLGVKLHSMSEWTEWHLTIRGWERGSQMHVSAEQIIETEVPTDRVLTCRYHENITINSTWMQKHITEIWQDPNLKIVEQMLEKFGNCPECL